MSDKAGEPPKGGAVLPAAPAALAATLPAPAAAPVAPLFPDPPPFVPTAKKAVPVSPHFDGDVLSLSARAAEAEPPAWAAAAAPEPPEYAERLSFGSQIQTYVGTTWATFLSSVVAPTAAGIGIAALFFVALGGSIAGSDLIAAATSQSIAPLMQGRALQMLAISSAAGALVVSVWSLKDYLFAGRRYLLERLTKNIPKDEATLERTPAAYVRFYHGVLRWCGAFAFLCEVVFQLCAFAIITWGIAVGFPGFALFKNPEQLTVMNTLLFWVEDAFAIVDGPETLGLAMSPLDPNKTIWAFGLTLIFFKIGVVGLILQLVRTSFTLRPGDISLAWQRAYERMDP